MATTEIIMLDRTLAYTIDTEDPTNALAASGFHLVAPNVRRELEDYISSGETSMSMEVVIAGAELRAVKFLENIGGYAVFPVYSGTGSEIFEGYLVIKDHDGKVCTLDGGIYLGSTVIEPSVLMDGIIAYLQDVVKRQVYTGAEDPIGILSAAMTEVSGLVTLSE
jgi:hypothetical protein